MLCEETNNNDHEASDDSSLNNDNDKCTSSFNVEDETSKASTSYYSNIDPLTQLSPEDDNSSLSNSSLETEISDTNLNKDNQSTRSN